MALVALRDVHLGFRGPLVLEGVDFTVEPGERVCVLGRNGTGKTTFLRLIHGAMEPDRGEIVRQQGLSVAMLPQEVPQDLAGTVFDEVARGLGRRAESLAEYHRIAHRLAVEGGESLRASLDRLQHELETDGGWLVGQEVDSVLSRMGLEPDADVTALSAGMKRRVLLAKALVSAPDILLLDEPTNHLDLSADPLVGRIPAAIRRDDLVRDARSRPAAAAGDPDRRNRSRAGSPVGRAITRRI